jgi:glutathione S-transferase
MTPLLFYGVPEGCSFGSIVALEWIGRPYRLCRVQMPEQVSSDAFRHINPAGETPTLLTADGRLLSESMAILGHLGAHAVHTGLWFAPGTPELDRATQALAYLNTALFNAFSPLWFALEHAAGGPARAALTDYGRQQVAKVHAHLEKVLRGQEWLAGAQRTLVDG